MLGRSPMPRDLETMTLYEDRYVYAMRRDHPSAGILVTLGSFCAIPQIFLGYGTSVLDDMIDDILARSGVSAWHNSPSPASARSCTSWSTATMPRC